MVFVETSFPRGGTAKPQQDESGAIVPASKKNEKMVVSTNNSIYSFCLFVEIFCRYSVRSRCQKVKK